METEYHFFFFCLIFCFKCLHIDAKNTVRGYTPKRFEWLWKEKNVTEKGKLKIKRNCWVVRWSYANKKIIQKLQWTTNQNQNPVEVAYRTTPKEGAVTQKMRSCFQSSLTWFIFCFLGALTWGDNVCVCIALLTLLFTFQLSFDPDQWLSSWVSELSPRRPPSSRGLLSSQAENGFHHEKWDWVLYLAGKGLDFKELRLISLPQSLRCASPTPHSIL